MSIGSIGSADSSSWGDGNTILYFDNIDMEHNRITTKNYAFCSVCSTDYHRKPASFDNNRLHRDIHDVYLMFKPHLHLPTIQADNNT